MTGQFKFVVNMNRIIITGNIVVKNPGIVFLRPYLRVQSADISTSFCGLFCLMTGGDFKMALTKTVRIDGKDVVFRASAAVPRLYRNRFGCVFSGVV